MSYLYTSGLGDVAADALTHLRMTYPQLRAQLVAEAATLTEPPSMWQRAKALISTENLDMNAPAGQSLLNAVARFDETMDQILTGNFSKAAQLQSSMETVVSLWSPNNDRPWSDLINAIIADIKALPKDIGTAAGSILRGAGEGVASGLGTTGVIVGVAILAAGLYVLSQTTGITRSITGLFDKPRKNPPRKRGRK